MTKVLLLLLSQLGYFLNEVVPVLRIDYHLKHPLEQLNDLLFVLVFGYLQDLYSPFVFGLKGVLLGVLVDVRREEFQVSEFRLPRGGAFLL